MKVIHSSINFSIIDGLNLTCNQLCFGFPGKGIAENFDKTIKNILEINNFSKKATICFNYYVQSTSVVEGVENIRIIDTVENNIVEIGYLDTNPDYLKFLIGDYIQKKIEPNINKEKNK